MLADGMVDGIVATWVRFESEYHPAKVYPLRVGSAGAVIAEPGWAVIAVIAVPSLDSKVIVTLATDDAVEDELEGIDDVDELEDGGRLELEEELEIVINPNTLIAITRTNPIRNHNQKGFLLFLSLSSSSL
jgi:hypothetical protein